MAVEVAGGRGGCELALEAGDGGKNESSASVDMGKRHQLDVDEAPSSQMTEDVTRTAAASNNWLRRSTTSTNDGSECPSPVHNGTMPALWPGQMADDLARLRHDLSPMVAAAYVLGDEQDGAAINAVITKLEELQSQSRMQGAAIAGVLEKMTARLRDQAMATDATLTAAAAEVKRLRAEVSRHAAAFRDCEDALASRDETAQSLAAELCVVKAELDVANSRIAKLAVDEGAAEQLAQMQQALRESKEGLAAAEEQLAHLKADSADKDAMLLQAVEKVETLRVDLANAETLDAAKLAEIRSLRAQVRAKTQELEFSQEKARLHEEVAAKLREELQSQTSQQQEQSERMDQVEQALSEARSRAAEMESNALSMASMLTESGLTSPEKAAVSEELAEELAEARRQLAEARATNHVQSVQLQTRESELAGLAASLYRLQTRIGDNQVVSAASVADAREEYLMRVVNDLRACLNRTESEMNYIRNDLLARDKAHRSIAPQTPRGQEHHHDAVATVQNWLTNTASPPREVREVPAGPPACSSDTASTQSSPQHKVAIRADCRRVSHDTAVDSCAATATERRYSEGSEDSGSEKYASPYVPAKVAPRRTPLSAPARASIIDACPDESAWAPWDDADGARKSAGLINYKMLRDDILKLLAPAS
eukprot:jgi/Chlat1/2216/Chrsp17S02542